MNLQSTVVSQFVSDYFYWVFLGILLLNITQRKYQKAAGRKRMATLYLSIAALVLYAAAQICLLHGFGDAVFAIVAVLVVGVVYYFRKQAFPFTLTCQRTGRRLDFHNILYNDSNSFPEDPSDETDTSTEIDDTTGQ